MKYSCFTVFCRVLAPPDFPGGISDKQPTCQCRRHNRQGFSPWVGKIPWRRAWQPTPVFLPGNTSYAGTQLGTRVGPLPEVISESRRRDGLELRQFQFTFGLRVKYVMLQRLRETHLVNAVLAERGPTNYPGEE